MKEAKEGDELTFASEYVTIGGSIIASKGQKGIVEKVCVFKGFWSRGGDWIPERVSGYKILGISGEWKPRAFEETKTT